MTDFHLIIDGQLVAGAGAIDVIDPSTEQPFASCPVADAGQLDAAVAAAKAAFPAWSARPLAERAALIVRLADALEARLEEFARLLTQEQGKPLTQARYEIGNSAGTLRAFAAMTLEPKLIRKEPSHVIEHRAALGVIAAIMPWNFPVILLMNKLGPALLTGNTMVAKPAPTTPLTTLLFGALASEILPPGVFNVICDKGDLGHSLTTHPDIAKIAFTGSTATGKKVMAGAAESVKRVTLELGGNDAAIVLDDVDPKEAALRVFNGAMFNAGQLCVAIKRAYVPQGMYDAFCDELKQLADDMVVDDGFQQGAQLGPVQNRAQYDRVNDLLADAAERGTVIAGGKALDRPGYFIPPTIIRDLDDDARIVREEQFGPVLPVLSYMDTDDVIARVNDSEYGLGGTVWSQDVARGMAIAERIDSGTIWVNQHAAIDPTIVFRGAKQSGLGGELGEEALLEYTQGRVVNAVPF